MIQTGLTQTRLYQKRLTLTLLALAALAAPASATIPYSYCSSGCNSSGGDYSSWQTSNGSNGLMFSGGPITFSPAGLSSGVYTDSTGAVFSAYNGATIDTLASVSGGAFIQGVNGTGTGIEIDLPANTYAVSMFISSLTGGAYPYIGIGTHGSYNQTWGMTIPNGGPAQFFGIVSDTPISSLFISSAAFSGKLEINGFELGEASPTPETSSLLLIGSGLMVLGIVRRRSRFQKPIRPSV
jgi:hypothetical protein